jgi:hypothetical protein
MIHDDDDHQLVADNLLYAHFAEAMATTDHLHRGTRVAW